jgi:hypothetical protein
MDGERIPGFKRYIQKYPQVDLGWKVKPWFDVDIEKLQAWYKNLEDKYSEWKFIYSKHAYMWKEDPGDPTGATGHRFQPDTAWYTLCWNGTQPGPMPPERGEAKTEWRDEDNDELYPRECFTGYALDLIKSMPLRSKRWLVTIHTPSTKLITHQDSPDKIRVHIPIYTNDQSNWIIDGEEFHMSPGKAYLVNTSLSHSVENKGTTDRIHLYGKIWTEDANKLFSKTP